MRRTHRGLVRVDETDHDGLGFKRLVGVTHEDNIPSRRIPEKAGLTPMGPPDAHDNQTTMLFVWERDVH